MGARAVGNFDNDAARDWLYDFGENDFRLIDRTLAGVAGMIAADELDAWEAQEVLVAAECVAAAAGFPPNHPPRELADWLAENSPILVKPEFIEMAQKAVNRVLSQSELRDEWLASDEFDGWETAVLDLQARLNQAKPEE
ncbi:MAG: DUF4259 domain-containing protein [Ardenticatenaceae bacterium]|nr:DUF4259 domain-containing protein [Anaerolineales bacterium]MCB8939054.1 DUF4259 domain-containing protein [Ardenticatenaceae bacterium]MCB8974810.1 DUF4259 domain-containing protein [Ardenticatenaceae bacterium]